MLQALENTSDPIYVLDASTAVLWANSAGAALVGLTREQIVGEVIADYVHPDDLLRAMEVLALAATGVFDQVPITTALYRVRDGNGEWVSIGVNASAPMPDGSMLLIGRQGGDLVLADQILEAVAGTEPFDQQVALVLRLGIWRYPLEGYAILYDEIDGSRRAITSPGLSGEMSGQVLLEGATPWQSALDLGVEVAIEDLSAVGDEHPYISPELAAHGRSHGMAGLLAAAVPDPGSEHDACIVIWTSDRGPTTAGHRYAMGNMKRALRLVLQQRAQLTQLERAARIDGLTLVTSRARFFELLDEADSAASARARLDASPKPRHVVLYIDLDGFKAVNDTHGHSVGDQVLVAAASRLSAIAPLGSVLARLGGDEFAVLCPSGTDAEHAQQLAQSIVDAMAEPMAVSGTSVSIGASVGVALGNNDESAQAVLDAADRALLAAKAEGRGRWHAAT